MATVRLGSIVSDIRGSVGAETYGRNQGGIFIRERVTPAQPASGDRDATQAALTAITQAWSATLTQAQRDDYQLYGQRFPLPDRFGRPRTLSGICHFLKCNAQRYRSESAITAADAPVFPPPPMPIPIFSVKLNAALNVYGSPVPDKTGIYTLDTPYGGSPAWLSVATAYNIWSPSGSAAWYLSTAQGDTTGAYWSRGSGPAGTYYPYGGASGNAGVSFDTAQAAVDVTVPPLAFPDTAQDVRLFAYAGIMVTTGRNYYSTPWRYLGTNARTSAVWTSDPWYLPHYEVLTAGSRLFLRLVAVLSDGATSIRGQASTDI